MAMDCGHFEKDKKIKRNRILGSVCPVCNTPTSDHVEVMPHIYCDCCEECWVLVDDSILNVMHDFVSPPI